MIRLSKNLLQRAKECCQASNKVNILQTRGLGTSSQQEQFHHALSKPRGTHLKSGAVKCKPEKIVTFGRLRAALLVGIFIYCGGQASSMGARMLHEYEIFELPEDDDEL